MGPDQLRAVRTKLMSKRKVVCTGNPKKPGTLAQGFQKIFPDAVFLCRDTGWDLGKISEDAEHQLRQVFRSCNTFLNCSYIAPDAQTNLLDICHDSVKFCDVVNIGSTHEYDGLGSDTYRMSKLKLRDRSLTYNSFRFSCCHFILGGIKNDDSVLKNQWLEVDLICETIVNTWNHSYTVPMMVMDQHKEPW
jgi:hypothetical protein